MSGDGWPYTRWGRGETWGEGKANGVDGVASNARNDQAVDWLEQSPDLPHLIARVSELVLRLGHDPEELVTLPRAELDRRETSAYSAGWADVVAEQLPAIRRAYEERITAAYLRGQEDARAGRRPRRARWAEGEPGGEVIQLPYVPLLHAPAEMTRVEERGERERSVADGTAGTGGGNGAGNGAGSRNGDFQPMADRPGSDGECDGDGRGRHDHGAREEHDGRDRYRRPSGEPPGGFLLSAREVRERRPAAPEQRPVIRRNGRPSVPPLERPGDTGAVGRDRGRRTETAERGVPGPSADMSGAGDDAAHRLSDRARALAEEFEGRATSGRRHEGQPEAPDPR
ncbi:hypothetical protein GCM10023220_60300 [Streptomyces ziwulingensis]|uniref:Uncharacterized protein n=1 Tax=Streptomyces ziwulingensis TaxID=1045501 RepID=A0ABP9CUE2_9ACTN